MYVLGIGMTHNATACLMEDGKIIAAASEERFRREKNFAGYPLEAVRYVLEFKGISLDEVDVVSHGYIHGLGWFAKRLSRTPVSFNYIDSISGRLFRLFPIAEKVARRLYHVFSDWKSRKNTVKMLKGGLGNRPTRIELVDHHLCHASAAYYGFAPADRPVLVFTHDGEGDGLCATVSIGSGANLERISSTKAGNSLAALYGAVTKLLGMKILEDEHKIMGLAPYASDHEVHKTYTLLRQLIGVRNLEFHSRYGFRATYEYLKSALAGYRFDGIAGAVQKLCEELCIEWIHNGIEKTGISDIALGGGLFLNVKVNMKIMQMPELNAIYPTPGGGDESAALGAAYEGYRLLCIEMGKKFEPKPLENLYLGPEYSDDYIAKTLKCWASNNPSWQIDKYSAIEGEVARLLAKGEIVARFSGRMEWGPRALGNRSILADPSDPTVVKRINAQIKSRDFWMPFAPTILYEREKDYIINPKDIRAPYMVLAFETTSLARKQLQAAIHPYDYTARPQILDRETNPSFYALIKEFEALTGVGAVLNTSFNLHGEPIVCSPEDALSTFERSGLKFLAIGCFLVKKGN